MISKIRIREFCESKIGNNLPMEVWKFKQWTHTHKSFGLSFVEKK